MGFAVAYSDNDTSPGREIFLGSVPIAGSNKNKVWTNADSLGRLKLIRE